MRLDLRIKIVTAGSSRFSEASCEQFESIDPTHAVLRSDKQLKSSVRDATRLPKLFVELARRSFQRQTSAPTTRRRCSTSCWAASPSRRWLQFLDHSDNGAAATVRLRVH